MKTNTYDNPRDEIIDNLTDTLGKIVSYQRYIADREPSNKQKQKHEQEKADSIRKAIEFLRRCPPGGSV